MTMVHVKKNAATCSVAISDNQGGAQFAYSVETPALLSVSLVTGGQPPVSPHAPPNLDVAPGYFVHAFATGVNFPTAIAFSTVPLEPIAAGSRRNCP